jgi:hypothetical protein
MCIVMSMADIFSAAKNVSVLRWREPGVSLLVEAKSSEGNVVIQINVHICLFRPQRSARV